MSSTSAPFGLRPSFHPSGLDRAVALAGGIASGLESIGSFAATGPVGALMTLGAIAANNSWQEGSTTWMDNTGKTYATKEEAIRIAGQSNISQLTTDDNMKRTAVMTALEIAGEAAGIPGMRLLMKGIPLTGSTGQIVNAVKGFGVGLANEQVSELLTTTAQMAADKWTSFGLGKDATLADFTKALQDTALATTAAVGVDHTTVRDVAVVDVDASGCELRAARIDADRNAHGRNVGATPKTRRHVSLPMLRMSYVEP
jgi:hypothetical protein